MKCANTNFPAAATTLALASLGNEEFFEVETKLPLEIAVVQGSRETCEGSQLEVALSVG